MSSPVTQSIPPGLIQKLQSGLNLVTIDNLYFSTPDKPATYNVSKANINTISLANIDTGVALINIGNPISVTINAVLTSDATGNPAISQMDNFNVTSTIVNVSGAGVGSNAFNGNMTFVLDNNQGVNFAVFPSGSTPKGTPTNAQVKIQVLNINTDTSDNVFRCLTPKPCLQPSSCPKVSQSQASWKILVLLVAIAIIITCCITYFLTKKHYETKE